MSSTLKRLLGLDTHADRYAYGVDPVMGHTAARKIPDRWVSTTCGYCSVGCGMFIGVKDGRAVSVRGNPDHPVNTRRALPQGTLGARHAARVEPRALSAAARRAAAGARGLGRGHRDDGAAGSARRRQKYGPESVGVISTGQLVTEEFYTLGKLVQLGLGTRNYDGNTTLCMSTAVSGYKRSFGSDGPPGAYEDLERADVILLIGANIADNHPILWQRLEANPGKTLIVVDPRVTKTAMLADLHLPLKPRSDLALINGLIHILIEQDLIDREYIAAHTTGFEALRESVREYTPERVSEITGLSRRSHSYRPRSLYGNARAGFIAWTMGVNHSTKGTETVNAINNLALITGHIGRSGAAPVLHHRPVQRDGDARSRVRVLAAGLSQVRARGGSRSGRRHLERAGRSDSDRARTRVSRHHRSGAEQAHPRAVGHRHQSDRVVSEPRRAPSGARDARLPRRPGRIPSDADVRARAPRAAGRDLGREGRHVHELRAARQQGESRGGSAWRSPQRLRHLSRTSRARSDAPTSCFRAGPRRRTRSKSGSACPPAASATTRA